MMLFFDKTIQFIGWPYLIVAAIGIFFGIFRQWRSPQLINTDKIHFEIPLGILILSPFVVAYGCYINEVCIYPRSIGIGSVSDTTATVLGLISMSGIIFALVATFWYHIGYFIGVLSLGWIQGDEKG